MISIGIMQIPNRAATTQWQDDNNLNKIENIAASASKYRYH